MIRALLTTRRVAAGGVFGAEQLIGALEKYSLQLAAKAHGVDREAGDDMVELMKSRVPVDSGRLLNGITSRVENGAVVVEASAIRTSGGKDFDYARVVEFGRKGGHATASFFSQDMMGAPRARRGQSGGAAEAEPFFLDSAEEVLRQRGKSLEDVMGPAARESGL